MKSGLTLRNSVPMLYFALIFTAKTASILLYSLIKTYKLIT